MRKLLKAISAAAINVGMVAVISCGGSGDNSPEDTIGETPREQATSVSTEKPDETSTAKSILLTVHDFPPGWAEERSNEESSPLDECDPKGAPGKSAEAETGDFSDGSDFTISQSVAIFESETHVTNALERIEEIAACFVETISGGDLDDETAEYSDASFSPLSFRAKGDDSRAYRFKFHVQAKGETGIGSEGDVFFDIVYLRVGRVGIQIYAFDTYSAPDPDEWEPYVDIAVQRAQTGVD